MNSDPIRLDSQFRALQTSFRYSTSPARRVLELAHFISQCGDNSAAAESYLLELSEGISRTAEQLDLVGTDPHPYLTALGVIRKLSEHIQEPSLADALRECEACLRKRCARLYAWAGNMQRVAVLARIQFEPPPDTLMSKNEDPQTILLWMSDREPDERARALLRWILAHWMPWSPAAHNAACIPVVAAVRSPAEESQKIGALCSLELDVHATDLAEDRLRSAHRFAGNGDEDPLESSVTAGRAVLSELFGGQARMCFDASAFLPPSIQAIEGRSARGASAALFVTGALQRSNARVQYRISPEAAITADCDEKGVVLPVNAATLPLKIMAAYHSWIRYIVVPEEQKLEAQRFVQEISGRGRKNLEVIGIRHVSELFHDRRLTVAHRVSLPLHAARAMWADKATTLSLLAAVLLLVALGLVLYSPLDRNPVAADWEGEYILAKNRYGQVIERIEVGSATVLANADRPLEARNAVFYDITGDGRNEIIWVQSAQQASAVPVIRAKQVGKDHLLWKIDAIYDISYPDSPDIHSPNFHSIIQLTLIPGRHGPAKLVAIMNHNFFPSVLMAMDAKTGTVLSRYVHPGHVRIVLPVEDDATGQTLLMLTGINNAFGRPFFAVLETQFLSGHGPATRPYIPSGYVPGAEKVYALLPYCTAIATVPNFLFPLGDAIRMFPDRSIELKTVYRFGPRDDLLGYQTDGLLHYFARDYRHAGVGRTSGYDRSIAQLMEHGHISELPPPEYYQQLAEQALYWDGYEWVNEPVINRRYLEKISETEAELIAGN